MEIIQHLAETRAIEQMVSNIAHEKLNANLQDLSQMVYIILLEYNPDKIVAMYNDRQLDFFIAKVIKNQYRTKNSPFHNTFRKHTDYLQIDTIEIIDGEN